LHTLKLPIHEVGVLKEGTPQVANEVLKVDGPMVCSLKEVSDTVHSGLTLEQSSRSYSELGCININGSEVNV
jgi:hypothetical protein